MRVYDDPKGRPSDDWTEIVVKRAVLELCVGSFERSHQTADLQLTWHVHDGLDAKVSHVEVDWR